ncbi:MAG: flagellar hook-basal body complex protein FliE [Planctomycetaceae bacterium]
MTGQVPSRNSSATCSPSRASSRTRIGTEVERLVTGETDNIHDLVVSVARADIAFRFLEVRDQLISSYQEVMRMQI